MYGLINNDYCYLQNEHFLAKNIFKNYFENLNLIPIINKNYCQSSKQGVSHPLLLTEPYVNLSIHTALQDASFN